MVRKNSFSCAGSDAAFKIKQRFKKQKRERGDAPVCQSKFSFKA